MGKKDWLLQLPKRRRREQLHMVEIPLFQRLWLNGSKPSFTHAARSHAFSCRAKPYSSPLFLVRHTAATLIPPLGATSI